MTHWFAAALAATLVLAGCGQTATEAKPPEAGSIANDCVLANEFLQDGTDPNGVEDVPTLAARLWPQVADSDLKEIARSISQAPLDFSDRAYALELGYQSLLGWLDANCPD